MKMLAPAFSHARIWNQRNKTASGKENLKLVFLA
jgi:hypothetical protein